MAAVSSVSRMLLLNHARAVGLRPSVVSRVRMLSTEPLTFPQGENTPAENKVYPDKIVKIVDQISTLNLLEVADLNELLKVSNLD